MSTYAIDFETFYSKEFSVTDLGYYHYVNHPSFDAYMVSIVGDDGPAASPPPPSEAANAPPPPPGWSRRSDVAHTGQGPRQCVY